jgi:CheY-like chemotaxis protein
MDGYILLRQIRSLTPEQGGQILAIALTAYAGEGNDCILFSMMHHPLIPFRMAIYSGSRLREVHP